MLVKKIRKKDIPRAPETLSTSHGPFFLFSSPVACPGPCPSSWWFNGGDGGHSSRWRHRPGLDGDGGFWSW
jgi:hypothetical protein